MDGETISSTAVGRTGSGLCEKLIDDSPADFDAHGVQLFVDGGRVFVVADQLAHHCAVREGEQLAALGQVQMTPGDVGPGRKRENERMRECPVHLSVVC